MPDSVGSGFASPFSLGGGGGGGGDVRDAKPYFTDRSSFVALIFCYKFNSTDKFCEG